MPSKGIGMLEELLRQSDLLMQNMHEVLHHPLYDDSARIVLSYEYAMLSLEHSSAVRCLLGAEIMPGAPILLRCQFESLLRSMWVFCCAPDEAIDRLGTSQTDGPDPSSANLPQGHDMLNALEKKPLMANAVASLREFQTHSRKPLNSYVHAGDHPLWRQVTGYPMALAVATLRQSNGLAMMAGMQLAMLTGIPHLQRALVAIAEQHPNCLPIPNDRLPE